jgi:hypothetical protein
MKSASCIVWCLPLQIDSLTIGILRTSAAEFWKFALSTLRKEVIAYIIAFHRIGLRNSPQGTRTSVLTIKWIKNEEWRFGVYGHKWSLFKNNNMKCHIYEFRKKLKQYSHVHNYLFHKRAKKPCSNILYFGLRKNKNISGSQYVFFSNLQIMTFCYFCISHNTKNFVVKFSILVGYIIVNVQIFFISFQT